MEIIGPWLDKIIHKKPVARGGAPLPPYEPKEQIPIPDKKEKLEIKTPEDLQQTLEVVLTYANQHKDPVLAKYITNILQMLEKRKQPSPEREKTEEELLQTLVDFVNSKEIVGSERDWFSKIKEKLPELQYEGGSVDVEQAYDIIPKKDERGRQLVTRLTNGPFIVFTIGPKHYMFPNVNYHREIMPIGLVFGPEGKPDEIRTLAIDAKLAEVIKPAILEKNKNDWVVVKRGVYKMHRDVGFRT